MKVRDILKRKPEELITVRRNHTLMEAAGLLAEHNIGVLLVMDGKKPIGILSERDIIRQFAEYGGDCETMSVEDTMTRDLIVGVPDDELGYVMNVMTRQRIRHLPVLDGDNLAGLISIGDVVKSQVSESEAEIRYLRSYITGMPT